MTSLWVMMPITVSMVGSAITILTGVMVLILSNTRSGRENVIVNLLTGEASFDKVGGSEQYQDTL